MSLIVMHFINEWIREPTIVCILMFRHHLRQRVTSTNFVLVMRAMYIVVDGTLPVSCDDQSHID